MKVTFDIDCTPEEARQFLGLPPVAAMQERLMAEMEEKLAENIQMMDAETLVKTWMPLTIQGWGELQQQFWNQFGGMGGMNPYANDGADSSSSKSKKKS